MAQTRMAGAAAPAWATAQTVPFSERPRSGGAFTDAEEAQIRKKVLEEKGMGHSVWMILGLILLLIIIFALLWFFFRSCAWGCGTSNGCCKKCGKKKCKCPTTSGTDTDD